MSPMRVVIRPQAVTFGDLEDFEATTGGRSLLAAVEALADQRQDDLTAAEHVSLVWIFARQLDPTFTREKARALQPSDVSYTSPEKEE